MAENKTKIKKSVEDKNIEDKEIDGFVLTFITNAGSKAIIPILEVSGKELMKGKDGNILVITNKESAKYLTTKKIKIMKYKDAINWINEK